MTLPNRNPGLLGGLAALFGALSGPGCSSPETPAQSTISVYASGETEPSGDDPDDPAIFIHPTDPSRSRIIATDKGLGVFVYDLEGKVVDSILGTAPNNIDLRQGVILGDSSVTLAAAVDRNRDQLAFFSLDDDGHLASVETARPIEDFGDLYGNCFYRDPSGVLYLFVNAKSGEYRQYALDTSSGKVALTEVRQFGLDSQPEGCVADDRHGWLFLGEEDVGLYRVGANPDDPPEVELLDAVGDGRLVADVEGMSIYPTDDGGGYLLVSSQGSDEFIVYERQSPHAYLTRFRIAEGPEVDAATDTDGIDVTPVQLGPLFPAGLFVAQDDHNEDFTRNFKLVRWDEIAAAADLVTVTDPER